MFFAPALATGGAVTVYKENHQNVRRLFDAATVIQSVARMRIAAYEGLRKLYPGWKDDDIKTHFPKQFKPLRPLMLTKDREGKLVLKRTTQRLFAVVRWQSVCRMVVAVRKRHELRKANPRKVKLVLTDEEFIKRYPFCGEELEWE